MKRANDLVRGIIHQVTIHDVEGFSDEVFGGGIILKKLKNLIESNSVYVNVDNTDGYYYFLNEKGRIFHDTMFIYRDELKYVTLGDQQEIICVNELSDVYIDELIQGDSLIDAEGDIYTVLNSEQSYIKFNTPIGHKKYQRGTEELKSFCNLIPGCIFEQDDGGIIDDNGHIVTVFKNYKNRRQRPNTNNQFHSEFFEAVKLCAEMGNERLKKMAEEVNKK